jgi:hypothetical protein
MNTWSDLIRALDQDEGGQIIKEVRRRIGEPPIISETPDSYNDPAGKTRFYKFIGSGLEFGFRSGKLNHIHFFVQCHEGYSAYKGEVLGRAAKAWNSQEVLKELGPASKRGGGRQDMLVGFVHQWVKYELGTYALRMEFSKDSELWKVTLMLA